MALLVCEECEKEFSEKAETCPNCGCPVSEMSFYTNKLKEITCPVKIKGNEQMGLQSIGKFGLLAIIVFILWGVSDLIMSPRAPRADNYLALFIFTLGFSAIVFAVMNLLPNAFKKRKNAKIIYNYFKTRYPILMEVKPNHKTLEVITKEGSDLDYLLFTVYMSAFKQDADAIVINSNNVISHVSGKKRIKTETTREIVATIVKYL
jgi:hypothetical protein